MDLLDQKAISGVATGLVVLVTDWSLNVSRGASAPARPLPWRRHLRVATAVVAVVLLVWGGVVVILRPPLAAAQPDIPCEQWQQMHPGWPCIPVPKPPPPGPPTGPPTTPPTSAPVLPGQPPGVTNGGSRAGALTPPPIGPGNGTPIVPVPGASPPALPGNSPSPPVGVPVPTRPMPPEPVPPVAEQTPMPPITSVPVRQAALCPLGRNPDGSCRGHSALNGSGEKVEIPDDYIYDPDCARVPAGRTCNNWVYMHDYCSGSPDQLPSPGANADFRGPCARHDQCLERGGTNNFCNNQLYTDMMQNCAYTYGTLDPRYELCQKNAEAYWTVVTAIQPPLPGKNGPW